MTTSKHTDLKELEDKIAKLEVSLLTVIPRFLFEDFCTLSKLNKEYALAKAYIEVYKEGLDYGYDDCNYKRGKFYSLNRILHKEGLT